MLATGPTHLHVHAYPSTYVSPPIHFQLPPDNHWVFKGREDKLSELDLHQGMSVLSGLTGVGTSSIAIRYLYLHQSKYKRCLYFDASKDLNAQYRKLVGPEGLSLFHSEEARTDEQIRNDVKTILAHPEGSYLVIYDNATIQNELAPFLPVGGKAKIIVASHQTEWEYFIKVEGLSLDDVKKFTSEKEISDRDLGALAAASGYLPIAVLQRIKYYQDSCGSKASPEIMYQREMPAGHQGVNTLNKFHVVLSQQTPLGRDILRCLAASPKTRAEIKASMAIPEVSPDFDTAWSLLRRYHLLSGGDVKTLHIVLREIVLTYTEAMAEGGLAMQAVEGTASSAASATGDPDFGMHNSIGGLTMHGGMHLNLGGGHLNVTSSLIRLGEVDAADLPAIQIAGVALAGVYPDGLPSVVAKASAGSASVESSVLNIGRVRPAAAAVAVAIGHASTASISMPAAAPAALSAIASAAPINLILGLQESLGESCIELSGYLQSPRWRDDQALKLSAVHLGNFLSEPVFNAALVKAKIQLALSALISDAGNFAKRISQPEAMELYAFFDRVIRILSAQVLKTPHDYSHDSVNLLEQFPQGEAEVRFKKFLADLVLMLEGASVGKTPSAILLAYAWPREENIFEAWVQPFLEKLREYLVAAGLNPELDFIDSTRGIPDFHSTALDDPSAFVFLFGTPSLRQKHDRGAGNVVCEEVNKIRRKFRKHKDHVKAINLFPKLKDYFHVLPDHFEYYTIINTWEQDRFYQNMKMLIATVLKVPPDHAAYNRKWEEFIPTAGPYNVARTLSVAGGAGSGPGLVMEGAGV
jgi:hypothetical protein